MAFVHVFVCMCVSLAGCVQLREIKLCAHSQTDWARKAVKISERKRGKGGEREREYEARDKKAPELQEEESRLG